MRLLVSLTAFLLSCPAFAKPAKDSTLYSKSLIWSTDRSQKAPVWKLTNVDFSYKFKYLDLKDESGAGISARKPVPASDEPLDAQNSEEIGEDSSN